MPAHMAFSLLAKEGLGDSMNIGILAAAGTFALFTSSAHAAESITGRVTTQLEATVMQEGSVSTCMLNFKAFDNNLTTNGQVMVAAKLGFILDDEDKDLHHYLSIQPYDVKSVEPVELRPIEPLAAHLEGLSVSTDSARAAQMADASGLATFFRGEDAALDLQIDMLKRKEVTVAFKRPNGQDVRVSVALTESVEDGELREDASELIRYGSCQAVLLQRLNALRGEKS